MGSGSGRRRSVIRIGPREVHETIFVVSMVLTDTKVREKWVPAAHEMRRSIARAPRGWRRRLIRRRRRRRRMPPCGDVRVCSRWGPLLPLAAELLEGGELLCRKVGSEWVVGGIEWVVAVVAFLL